MDLGLKSKTAVVTGASIGIGRAIAKGLAGDTARQLANLRDQAIACALRRESRAPQLFDFGGVDEDGAARPA